MGKRVTGAPLLDERLDKHNDLRMLAAQLRHRKRDHVQALAAKYGVSTTTIYNWLKVSEGDPSRLPVNGRRMPRGDRGDMRIPSATVEALLAYFWEHPKASVVEAQAWLRIEKPELAYWVAKSSGRRRAISDPTVRKVRRIFLKGWEEEQRRSNSPL